MSDYKLPTIELPAPLGVTVTPDMLREWLQLPLGEWPTSKPAESLADIYVPKEVE